MEATGTFEHKVGSHTSPDVNAYLESKAPDLGVRVPDRSNSTSAQFPIKLTNADPRDEIMALKAQMLASNASAGGAQNGVLPGVGMATATTEDFRYFRDKELAERQGDFKRFFLENIDLSDPVHQDYYQRVFPQIFEERETLAEKQIEHQAHLMKINLRGPRNMEDWMFLYGIDRGFIQIPDGPIWDPSKQLANTFEGGLFSIRKILPRTGKERSHMLPGSVGASNSKFGNVAGLKVDWQKPISGGDTFAGGKPGLSWIPQNSKLASQLGGFRS
jgi:hypothetical protein